MSILTQYAPVLEPFLKANPNLLIHGFRSGGGLRVLRTNPFGMLEPPDNLPECYGESYAFPEALRILVDDIKAGGREYHDVYGGIEEHYLTGQSEPTDAYDAWLVRGNTIDIRWLPQWESFWFDLVGYEQTEHLPKDILKRVCEYWETIIWKDSRGVTFELKPSAFPNGETGCSMIPVYVPEGISRLQVSIWQAMRRGISPSLVEAAEKAFMAPKIPWTKP